MKTSGRFLVTESGLYPKMGIGVVFISRLIFSPYGNDMVIKEFDFS